MKGLVVKNTGSWYTVRTDDGQLIESKIKGNFRLKGIRSTNPVAVGDRVELIQNQEGTAFTPPQEPQPLQQCETPLPRGTRWGLTPNWGPINWLLVPTDLP